MRWPMVAMFALALLSWGCETGQEQDDLLVDPNAAAKQALVVGPPPARGAPDGVHDTLLIEAGEGCAEDGVPAIAGIGEDGVIRRFHLACLFVSWVPGPGVEPRTLVQ